VADVSPHTVVGAGAEKFDPAGRCCELVGALHSWPKLFLRELPVTTDLGTPLIELLPGWAGPPHTLPCLSPPLGFASPGFQPLPGSPQFADHRRMNAQTPASAFNDPEHWRRRAEEARRMADLMSDIPSKEAMLRIAEDYERLAKPAEERAKRSP
jgi:hypothetical protein